MILFNRQSLAEIKQMQLGDFTDRYFYEQLCSVFCGTERKLVLPESETFKKEDVMNTETKVNDVSYMDIARFLIRNFEMSTLSDYDNEMHSKIIYDGLTNFPTIAKCLANIYQNLKEKEKENIENEL